MSGASEVTQAAGAGSLPDAHSMHIVWRLVSESELWPKLLRPING